MSELEKITRLLRYYCLISTTAAGSGHVTSSLSAVELMTVLMFGGFFHFQLNNPSFANNDRLIFSKGHASPLFYSLWAVAGKVTEEELLTLRKFGSPLEGHPTMAFPYTEVPTGSLGQGLSVGVGMAINAKYLDQLPYKTFVLLGDSEMAEGEVWEAIELAAHYKLDNLIGVIDVNRLGQRGETLFGHDVEAYQQRVAAFGWETIVVNDGHDLGMLHEAYEKALQVKDKPVMVIAKTQKGHGVSLVADQEGWHGRALSQEQLMAALQELGEVDKNIRGEVAQPENLQPVVVAPKTEVVPFTYTKTELVATRKAYGNALARLADFFPEIVVLDAEVSNSTFSEIFRNAHPERFFEMYIAEQNMVGTALGLARRRKVPFVSSFAAFLTRAFDQFRIAGYSGLNLKVAGSHAGVSIGEDGPSQMGLEDIALFRSIFGSTVLYPSDAVSTEKLVEAAVQKPGVVYLRTTRAETPVIYDANEEFPVGGSKVVRHSDHDLVTVIGAGITLHEALKAHDILLQQNVAIRVIDLYSIKPLDVATLQQAVTETKALIIVEDHYPAGGIAEAVRSEIVTATPIFSLAVRKMPKSGKPQELLDFEEISAGAIVKKVQELL